MNPTLEQLQHQFQDCLLGRAEAHDLIAEGPRETRQVMLGIYQHAYGARLREVLANDYEQVHAYLGDEGFVRVADAYIASHPSRFRSARRVGELLPEFVRCHEPWSKRGEIADLAALEHALNDVFDERDEPALALDALSGVSGEAWPQLQFQPILATRRLTFGTNAADIWSALKHETAPPAATADSSRQVLVYRQEDQSRFRSLSGEEAMMWDEMAKGVPFGHLCEMVATYGGEDDAAVRAAGYLGGWIAAGIIAAGPAE